jgi:hypothetical protein
MRGKGHVGSREKRKNVYKIVVRKPKETTIQLEIDGRQYGKYLR